MVPSLFISFIALIMHNSLVSLIYQLPLALGH